jgi:predicted transposase YbfD/YdcC
MKITRSMDEFGRLKQDFLKGFLELPNGDFSAEELLKYIRGHRSTENQLHWMLDIVFWEDECRVRTGNAALNLNILRKMALYRLRKIQMEKKQVSPNVA